MKEIVATLPVDGLDDLQKPPHVMSQFIDLLTGELQQFSTEPEQRWGHLEECLHCQVFLGSYLAKLIEYNEKNNNPVKPEQELLTRLIQVMHETLRRDIPAYIEVFEEQGEKEASKRFPQLTEHFQTCQDCCQAVEDLRVWLRQEGLLEGPK